VHCTQELEKTKGNESFRVAENQEAIAYYSRALAYHPRAAVVWANRAMAYIRLELFDLAEQDSSVALLLDPAYVKAYSRRGLVRFKRGKYALVCTSPVTPIAYLH
jgi:tetratricopeptide (TPR) repeat protein